MNDLQTAEYVSGSLGEETIIVNSGGTSTGRSRQTPDHGSHGSSSLLREFKRELATARTKFLQPEEVLAWRENRHHVYAGYSVRSGRHSSGITRGIQEAGVMMIKLWEKVKMFACALDAIRSLPPSWRWGFRE